MLPFGTSILTTRDNVYICPMIDFIIENWGELVIGLLAFGKVIVNLTPTESDNQVFGWLDSLINMIIADRRKTPTS